MMVKEIKSLDEALDFVWELSQKDDYAGYPGKKTMEEIKNCIEKAIKVDSENIIAQYNKNVLNGVCIYHWDCNEKFVQTTQLLIREDYDKTADEILAYMSKQLSGYDLYIPLPHTNKNAENYFIKNNIECIEAFVSTRLCNLGSHLSQKNNSVVKITNNDFEEYAIFHDKYAIPSEMYYYSKNLKKDIDRFRILAFKKDNIILGSIFVKIAGDAKNIAEVFGVFIDKEYINSDIGSILINEIINEIYNEFGEAREIILFIGEDENNELNIVLNAGFEITGRPRTYKYML